MRTTEVALGRVLRPRDEPNHPELPVLSVYRAHGVVPKDSRDDNYNKTPEDRTRYLRVQPGDLVVNKMKAWSGSVAVSEYAGIVSGDYLVCETSTAISPRFLHHLLRSAVFIGQMKARSKGIRPDQERLYWEDLAEIKVRIPEVDEQERIARFLDDQVARIDGIIAARVRQMSCLSDIEAHAAFHAIAGSEHAKRKPSGLQWLGSIPVDWPMATVHAGYSVMLGKMLDESRFTGVHPLPYLRNTNVQWDRISTDDLKVMDIAPDERERFTVRAGDLLICEGGQPGRSAVWDGRMPEMGYQKALHRARPRDGNDVRWLQAFLRVAVQQAAFSTEFGQATIGHLTGEQLRSLRLPLPSPDIQTERADNLRNELATVELARQHFSESVGLYEEIKKSLITAAVTGDFDVSSADGCRVSI